MSANLRFSINIPVEVIDAYFNGYAKIVGHPNNKASGRETGITASEIVTDSFTKKTRHLIEDINNMSATDKKNVTDTITKTVNGILEGSKDTVTTDNDINRLKEEFRQLAIDGVNLYELDVYEIVAAQMCIELREEWNITLHRKLIDDDQSDIMKIKRMLKKLYDEGVNLKGLNWHDLSQMFSDIMVELGREDPTYKVIPAKTSDMAEWTQLVFKGLKPILNGMIGNSKATKDAADSGKDNGAKAANEDDN